MATLPVKMTLRKTVLHLHNVYSLLWKSKPLFCSYNIPGGRLVLGEINEQFHLTLRSKSPPSWLFTLFCRWALHSHLHASSVGVKRHWIKQTPPFISTTCSFFLHLRYRSRTDCTRDTSGWYVGGDFWAVWVFPWVSIFACWTLPHPLSQKRWLSVKVICHSQTHHSASEVLQFPHQRKGRNSFDSCVGWTWCLLWGQLWRTEHKLHKC